MNCPVEWGKLDTLAVIAGVSSLKPLLATAGVDYVKGEALANTELEGVKNSLRIANAAMQGNFVGPYTAAITFVSSLIYSFILLCPNNCPSNRSLS